MIFIMGVYNTAVHTGGLKYSTFVYAAYSFLPEWLIGFLLAFFYRRQSCKTPCFQSCGTARQSNFYHFVHTSIYGLCYVAFNEYGRSNRAKRNYRGAACNMAANSSDKFCYGFSSADIFSRSALPVYFQSYIQIINNLSRLSCIYTTQIRKYCFPAVYVIK